MLDSQHKESVFLAELGQLARRQAKLHHHRWLPHQLDWLTSLIGRYSWQALLFFSGFTAVALTARQAGWW